jgi:hypothetical protein
MEECYFSKKNLSCPFHESETHKIKHWHYKDGKAELFFYHLRQHNLQFTTIVQNFKEDFEISSKHKQKIQGGDLLLLESNDRKALTSSIENFDFFSASPITKVLSVSEDSYVELNNSNFLDSLDSKFHLEEKKLSQDKTQFLVYLTNFNEKNLNNDVESFKKTMTIFHDVLHDEYEKLNKNKSFEDLIQIEKKGKSEEEKRRENGYYIKELINYLRKKTLTKENEFKTSEICYIMVCVKFIKSERN